MKFRLFCFVAATLAVSFCAEARAGLDECFDAVVKIHTNGGAGSGCCWQEDNEAVYILTNAHVVGAQKGTVTVIFHKLGHASSEIEGQAVWVSYGGGPPRDLAIVRVGKDQLGGHLPKIIPLAPEGVSVQSGETICSIGCPKAHWPNGFRGHVTKTDDAVFSFQPGPLKGRSGSAVFDAAGTHIVGVIAWNNEKQPDSPTEGYAITAAEVYRALRGEPPGRAGIIDTMVAEAGTGVLVGPMEPVKRPSETQCGPQGCPPGYGGSCPPGGCLPQRDRGRQFQLFGQQRIEQHNHYEPWPTLPKEEPLPEEPKVEEPPPVPQEPIVEVPEEEPQEESVVEEPVSAVPLVVAAVLGGVMAFVVITVVFFNTLGKRE